MIHSAQRRGRRGTILILFALIVFALMALAAIVIDLGFVRLTQQEMQTGTDTAALEGLRWRDGPPKDLTGLDLTGAPNPTDQPAYNDFVRRKLAAQVNALQYDADYDLNTTDAQFGAGPVISFTGGVTRANALQSVTGTSVYKPGLQLNAEDNDQSGDMAAGTFTSLQPPQPSTEAQDYIRNDFTASPASASTTAASFLVRMRRTNDPRETATNTAGVSSVGPSLPLLFGRGSMIAGGDPNAGYSVRFHGLTVRSTSIADGRPVVVVGRAMPADPTQNFSGLRGITPFWLNLASWTDGVTFPDRQRVNATVDPSGSISIAGGGAVGSFHNRDPQTCLTALGQTLNGAAPPAGLSLPPPDSPAEQARLDLYVPLVDSNNRIAAFGFASMTAASGTTNVQIKKQAGAIAPENATASPARIPNLDAGVVTLLSAAQNPMLRPQLLLAPVLVR